MIHSYRKRAWANKAWALSFLTGGFFLFQVASFLILNMALFAILNIDPIKENLMLWFFGLMTATQYAFICIWFTLIRQSLDTLVAAMGPLEMEVFNAKITQALNAIGKSR